ncbi:hypothetical protein, partial [Acinetobacter baumannii]|uniref:hypothetical protein n=1 Tax=Acinetobacter baumannii TaxID=470 RepID=UPI0028A06114
LARTVAAYVQPEGGHWIALPALPVRAAGFDEDTGRAPGTILPGSAPAKSGGGGCGSGGCGCN